ncbi:MULTISPECIES: YifB family Mg chelatase-like AAA ATPase [unclassified Corynebacterium]|uniref:YifB family Mg chelatase-like AAA ATPase n=1 Tax=unclassified Corynebacterium TaxID=2624378 RepID=UPI0029CA9CE3|nr:MULTISPECIES: YifB family Mg chelatase-like AAA ATPase [unclassified Corynebacterium]WPF67281.1 YifB family Mg chelatase-like AAA ATPase [Corynebacterium sp. 22KM0430]WPF67828.1 YifB family Mg chelatase-like AAA ATPase [Corynebacterium sp. 21KM1197]
MALHGVRAHPVTVEANIGPGLPGMYMVGLGDASVRESRDRIRTAVANSGLAWPRTKIIVSLSPASLPKSGGHFDLSITLAVLSAMMVGEQAEEARRRLGSTLLLGEVALDGTLRPVSGALPALLGAQRQGLRRAVVPPGNEAEAALVGATEVLVAPSLMAVVEWARGERELPRARRESGGPAAQNLGDFSEIAGQHRAVRAAEVAAAGGHHFMLIGPPGSGKSMIAQRLPTILPALTQRQTLEATAVHSVAAPSFSGPVSYPPFIAPHHSISRAGLLGGGSGIPRPGAVTLAHHGILFLDEVSEIPAAVLDGLRTPLDNAQVRLIRAHREYLFPARFQLVLAANPCRCAANDPQACRCLPRQRATYLDNLSGPLRDRLDIIVRTSAVGAHLRTDSSRSSAELAANVAQARQRSRARWRAAGRDERCTSEVPPPVLRRHFPATEEAMLLLEAYLAQGTLSQRAVDRALAVAWTLSDLSGGAQPGITEVSEAIDLHGSLKE